MKAFELLFTYSNSKWVLCIALSIIINSNAKIKEYQSIDIKIFETVLVKCRFHVARFGAQQLLYNDSFLKQTNVPLQVLPSPVYPALHAHACDPTVLLNKLPEVFFFLVRKWSFGLTTCTKLMKTEGRGLRKLHKPEGKKPKVSQIEEKAQESKTGKPTKESKGRPQVT